MFLIKPNKSIAFKTIQNISLDVGLTTYNRFAS